MATTRSVRLLSSSADAPREESRGEYFGDVVGRRGFLKAGVAGVTLVALPRALEAGGRRRHGHGRGGRRLRFEAIAPDFGDSVRVPEGYEVDVVVRWGDPLFPGALEFDLLQQTAGRQAQQFGFNCDFVATLPLPRWLESAAERRGRPGPRMLRWVGTLFPSLFRGPSRRSLLWVNHEYTTGTEMFPGYSSAAPTQVQVETEIAAHGASVLGMAQSQGGAWRFDVNSPFNRRITGETPIRIAGPAAGHPLLQTSEDPSGRQVRGMFNNCGGGITPWGTILTAEENFDQYFANFDLLTDAAKRALYQSIAPPRGASERRWEAFDPRFDVSLEPNEYARFGYIVEVDPYDPQSVPVKHTALGRFKHEAAAPTLTRSSRVAVYMGDDAQFEYVYKFVSAGRYERWDRAANQTLLDEGILYVARFHEDGTGEWLPLVHGTGPLTAANGFPSQADVLINTRGAADLLGATKMDRPEDVEVSPVTGKVYVALTNNSSRRAPSGNAAEDAANPRFPAGVGNRWGHVVEIAEHLGDAGAPTFRWEIFLLCGDPANATHGDSTFFAGFDKSRVSPIACPDNLEFDDEGNLWIATDGQPGTASFGFGQNDAIFAVPTEGPERGFVRQFLSAVPGAEVASLKVSGDQRTLFASIQHPGENGGLAAPTSHWPDGAPNPPRPSVIAVRHKRGKPIGNR
jgi:secreted PhoX family phosphatase